MSIFCLCAFHQKRGTLVEGDKRTADDEVIKCLTAGESERLIESIPHGAKLRNLRDRAIVALMILEGLRRVETCRAKLEILKKLQPGCEYWFTSRAKKVIFTQGQTLC